MTYPMFRQVFVSAALLLSATLGQAETADDDREGGIIGTGIVGTITELGSIHVNGQRVVFASNMQVSSVLGPLAAGELTAGDTVAIVAHPEEQHWNAQNINRQFAIIGPVVTHNDDRLVVMGTHVETREVEGLREISVGDWVAVSGLWQGDRIISSKVETIAPRSLAYIKGSYLPLGSSPTLLIGDTRITGISPEHVRPGDVIQVEGIPSNDGLAATRLWPDTFLTQTEIVSIEGYLSAPTPTGLYTMLGSGLVAFTDQPGMIDPLERTIRCGVGQKFANADTDTVSDQERDILGRLGCR